jgi:bifunctional non-homologous end joining protein LigD
MAGLDSPRDRPILAKSVRTEPSRSHPQPFIEPALPTPARKPPAGVLGAWNQVRWLRLFAQRQGIGGRLLTRSGYDWSERYPAVLKAVMALKINSCLIDGEVAICDERGVAVFDRLRRGPRVKPEAVLFAFDLLCIARMRPQRHHPAR